ncbi:O-Antigen ligase [Rubripirellula lacrimiformis]|uniref:O-Antigen ligase n=1 Tax=Rubripirellula lacrimiformis TaxID=1930273 RepID=A0A517N966_9BACT|nr:O-antigen ligase family protein [Rubripirellula lacrimiformis]QDT03538.1 O-Antigen ligase [Rubripirellula lacrimiformis]
MTLLPIDSLAMLRHNLMTLTACATVAVPGLVALDCGGLLPWDLWISSVAVMALVIATWFVQSACPPRRTPSAPFINASPAAIVQHYVTETLERGLQRSPMVLWAAIGLLALAQSIPLDSGTVWSLSPASADAFTQWLPQATGQPAPQSFPVSVSAWLTKNFAAFAMVMAAMAYVAGTIFRHRHLVLLMMIGMAIVGVVHSALGFYQSVVSPGVFLFGDRRIGHPFGTFINRNNAGAMLNLGLAAAVGLLVYRSRNRRSSDGMVSHKFGGFSHFHRMAQSVSWWMIVLATVFISAAIVACGSRGALLGSACGATICVITVASSRRLPIVVFAVVVMFAIAMVTLGAAGIETTAVDRLLENHTGDPVGDGRAGHWPDAWRSALASFPIGGGMGAYRYAYLPFQATGGGNWYRNADNQWLEWLVEGGLAMALILLAAGIGTIVAFRRLLRTSDPIDYGLALAGIFATTAIATSQTFDFALTLPPIAMTATLLAAAVHARQTPAAPRQRRDPSHDQRFARIRQRATENAPHRQTNSQGIHPSSTSGSPHGRPAGERRSPVTNSDSEEWFEEFQSLFIAPSQTRSLMLMVVPVLIIAGLILSTNRAAAIASADSLQRHSQWLTDASGSGSGTSTPGTLTSVQYANLQSIDRELDLAIQRYPDCEPLMLERIRVLRLLFRSERIQALTTQGVSAEQASLLTRPHRIRWVTLRGGPSSLLSGSKFGDPPLDRDPRLESIAALSRQALEANPLSEIARWNLVQLDLTGTPAETCRVLLDQLSVLRGQSPSALDSIARAALDIQDTPIAIHAWQRMLALDPSGLPAVIQQLRKRQWPIRLNQLLPPQDSGNSIDDAQRSSVLMARQRQLILDAARLQNSMPPTEQDPKVLTRAMEILSLPITADERALKQTLTSPLTNSLPAPD